MADDESEHEAIEMLRRRILVSFPTMRRRDGRTDQEIISEIAKDSDLYLAGEERFWNSQEQFEATLRGEAIKLKLLLMMPEEMVSLV